MIEFFSSDPEVTLVTDDGTGPKDRTLEALKDKVQKAKEYKQLVRRRYQQAEKDLYAGGKNYEMDKIPLNEM